MGCEINADRIVILEEQIKQHEKIMFGLKRSRNSLLNVSTLPPEVLSSIFCWNMTLDEPFDGLKERPYNFLLVCHHWFEVASRTPELWAFWGNNLEHWEERHLRSSVGVPLDLVLNERLEDTYDSFSESQRVALEDRAARDTVRRLHICSDSDHLTTSVISPLLSPRGGLRTNNLESLILRSEDPIPVDVSFLAHSHLPKLRHLELDNWTVSSWDHLASQGKLLTTLALLRADFVPRPTMPQILSMLASNLHLRTLVLEPDTIPNDDDGLSFRMPLYHLEDLQLKGDVGQVVALLRRIEHPQEWTN